ncbi:MAG: chromosome partitioning protein ParB, partial [Bauldia sp.]
GDSVEAATPEADAGGDTDGAGAPDAERTTVTIGGQPVGTEDGEEAVKPLPERLVAELTAHRTIALRNAVGANPHIAVTALLHRLVRDTFKRSTYGSAVRVSVQEVYCSEQGVDLKHSPYAKEIDQRHEGWKADLPADPDDLWDWLDALDDASRMALLAHCVSFGVNALYERPNPLSASGISEAGLRTRMAEADRLARVTGLDMAEAGFRPTVANYFGRITKRKILEAVSEAVGDHIASLLAFEKKDKMAAEAEERLANTGWLPEPLRLAVEETGEGPEAPAGEDESDIALPAFLAGEDAEADTDDVIPAFLKRRDGDDASDADDDPAPLVAAE